MEENRDLILSGCKLARDVEENLQNLDNQPEIFLRSCDNIIRVFSYVKERLSRQVFQRELDVGIQGLLRSGVGGTSSDHHHHSIDLPNAQAIPGHGGSYYHDPHVMDVDGGVEGSRGSGWPEIKAMDPSNPGPGTSSSQRQRRRKDEENKIVIKVPAPQMGNLDLPPEDGFTWRKYGQKEILGCKHPRSYYRCTHQKLYNCPAKKQVQRLDDDFYTFEVTYRGIHTCNIASSTAPSATVPPPVDHGTPPHTTAMQPPMSHWLSMEIKPPPEVEPTIFDTRAFRYPDMTGGAGPSSSGNAAGGGGAGPSGQRLIDYQPVADFADAMFNSGSSSNNSMELIFPSTDENWDIAGEKKN